MGLLDYFNVAPQTQAKIGGLLDQLQEWQSPDNPMRVGRENLRRRALEDELMGWKRQDRQAQIDEIERQRAKQAGIESAYRSAIETPAQQAFALPGQLGPTQARADAMATMSPRVNQQKLIQELMMFDPMKAAELATPKPRKLMTVKPDEMVLDEADPTKPLFTAPGKRPEIDPNKPFMLLDGKIVPNPDYQKYAQDLARAGASSVSVNTGQKGYENESRLRNDFRSEPIYGAYQEMKSAYQQIQAAINQGTPIGDVATATKIMKLLDPGSVVRESELGIAMAAAGKLDRLKNYFEMKLNGDSLTPTQRKEFGALATELMRAAEQSYNSKRADYARLGERYKLDTSVLGDESRLVPPQGGAYSDADKERRYQEWKKAKGLP